MSKKGIFISFEGVDGSGKSTILKMLYKKLLDEGKEVVLTREPGGTNNKIAEDIRTLLLNKVEYSFDYRAEALLFAASRAQHVSDFINPSLEEGKIVLCDRYIDSSLVYQGLGRGLGIENVWKINEFAMNGTLPKITFVFMVSAEIGLERIKATRGEKTDRMDNEALSMHQKVYDGYRTLLDEDKTGRLVEIDASKNIEEVFEQVYEKITPFV